MKHTNTEKDRFLSLKASYSASGLTTRVHGNTKHAPKNALKFEEIKNLLSFINYYAEKHAILLPGRIPGYKDNLQLLPSSTTKKVSLRNNHNVHRSMDPTFQYIPRIVGSVGGVQVISG